MAFKKAYKTIEKVLPVVNMETLTTALSTKLTKVARGKLKFIPLFTTEKSGIGLSRDEVATGLYSWFDYQCILPGEDKPRTIHTSWIDTGLRAGENDATLTDPGVMLDMQLPANQRINIPGFGVPGRTWADNKASQTTIRFPALINFALNAGDDVVKWDDTKSVEANAANGAGEVVLIDVNEAKFKAILAQMDGIAKKTYNYEGDAGTEKITYAGFGYAYVIELDKDTSRGMGTYEFKRTEHTVHPSNIKGTLEVAAELFAKYKENAVRYGRPYQHYIDDCEAGKLEFEVAERLVFASIAEKLLSAWGVPTEDETESIIETFMSVYQGYRLGQTSNSEAAVISRTRLNLDEEETEGEELPF